MATQISGTVHRSQKTAKIQFMVFCGLYSNCSILAGFLRKYNGLDYTLWSSVCDSFCTSHFFFTSWPVARCLSLKDDYILIAVVWIGSRMRKETKISVATERKTGKAQLLGVLLATGWLISTHVHLGPSLPDFWLTGVLQRTKGCWEETKFHTHIPWVKTKVFQISKQTSSVFKHEVDPETRSKTM